MPDVTAASAPSAEVRIVLRRRAIVISLAAIIAALTVLSLAGQISKFYFGHPTVFGLVPFLYLDLESNLPTWFQSVNLLFATLLLAAIGVAARRKGEPFAVHWLILAGIVLFLSLDEMAMIHERAIEPIQRITGRPEGMWAPTWIFVALALVAVVGLFFLRFFLHLRPHMRLRLAAAAVLFVLGSVALEMVAAAAGGDEETFTYVLLSHAEEVLEMVAVVVLIDALLRQLQDRTRVQLAVAG
ncbi:MAG TPA: hypothetical protein VF274_02985 [Alphaproteobacteria bacterium]